MRTTFLRLPAALAAVALIAPASAELITNPGFTGADVNIDADNGDGWGSFGNVSLTFDFFNNGNDGHATFFADNPSNSGGFFQLGIAATPGATYTFVIDASFEAQYDARTRFGLEFYAADDSTKLGESLVEINESLGTGYTTLEMAAAAPAGTAIVRPIVLFDQVASGGTQRAATFDNASLTVPEPGAFALMSLGLLLAAGRRR